MASDRPDAHVSDRPIVFGDALLLGAGAFIALTALAIGLQLLLGVIDLPEAVADVLDPVLSIPPLLSEEVRQFYSYAAMVTALVGAVAAWWMHGRPLRWSMAIGFAAGLGVIYAIGAPLLAAAERGTSPRGAAPLWSIGLWGIAMVLHFAFVVWTLADAVRDLRAPLKLHRRLDWLRIVSVVLLILLGVAVPVVLALELAEGAGTLITATIMSSYIAGFMVLGGDVVCNWLSRRAERNALIKDLEAGGSAGLQLTPELEERLGKLVAKLAKGKAHHHVICSIASLDGSFRWDAAVGEADTEGTPITIETPYFIASIDKLYIATAILRLHERGRLQLDEPIATYLPQTLVGGIHVIKDVDRSGEITVRHLLGHTSGLPDFFEERPKGNYSLLKQITKLGDRSWDTVEAMRLVREGLAPHFEPQPLDAAKPKVRYSDTNYLLLIAMIETLYAKPLHEVFAEEIFRPLGMKHTWMLAQSEPIEKPAAEPAALWFGKKPLEVPQALASLRSTYSTAADQITSLRAIMTGEIFDDPATLALMKQHWKSFALPLNPVAMRAPSWPIQYGLGMMRFELPGWSTPLGKVPAVIGHTGSTGSWMFFCPALELMFVGTVDQAAAGPVPFRFVPKLLHEIAHKMQ